MIKGLIIDSCFPSAYPLPNLVIRGVACAFCWSEIKEIGKIMLDKTPNMIMVLLLFIFAILHDLLFANNLPQWT